LRPAIGMRADRLRHQHGFSLLEVLVATTILTVGVLSLAQLLSMAISANALAGAMTHAALLAAHEIEDLRAEPWELLAGNTGEFTDHAGSDGTFTRQWSITPLPADPANTLVIAVVVRRQLALARLVTVRTRAAP
jgi:type IV pilus modification protein PilV